MSYGADPTPDYVLFYARVDSVREEAACQMKEVARKIFWQLATESYGLVVDKQKFLLSASGKEANDWWAPFQSVYWSFSAANVDVLLREAEFVKMELPLKARNGLPLSVPDDDGSPASEGCCCEKLKPETRADGEDEMGQTDENADFICAPFIFTKKHLYYGGSGRDFHLTRAQRIYLTYSILNRIRIDSELRKEVESNPDLLSCDPSCMHCSLKNWLSSDDCEKPMILEHLLEANVFTDAYALHDPTTARSSQRPACCGQGSGSGIEPQRDDPAGKFARADSPDLRRQLIRSWHCCCRFQPLRLIRLYFGERLAFYYAWFGYIIWSLLFLAAIGLTFFVYGLVNASINYKNATLIMLSEISAAAMNNSLSTSVASTAFIAELMQFVLLTFENYLTIVFGCVLTVWSLLTTETWKRYQGSLSYRWDVNNNYIAETRRPAYVLRKSRCQPICCTQQIGRRKCIGFYACVTSCIIIVFAITVGFQTARLVSDQMYCSAASSGAACFIISTMLPIGGQVIVISVLDSVYSLLAKAVTNWEGHEYPTDYDNSFAIKAFAFRFANNYSPLFYIAFVRQGRISIGSLTDHCSLGGESIDCFSLLNIMTACYMVGKSMLKSALDICWPYLKRALLRGCALRALRSLMAACCPCARMLAYSLDMEILAEMERQLILSQEAAEATPASQTGNMELLKQRHLAVSKENEMLLDEYLEKFVLYGFMVMFGSAFYLAPVAALLAMIIDLQLDSKRLLFIYRRPVPLQAQGIGVWNWMMEFINFAGIVTTGAILAFTSQSLAIYGVSTTDANRLIFFVIFENVMLAVKFLLSVSIADMPRRVKLSLKWEYYYVPKILADGKVGRRVQNSLRQLHDKSRWFHALLPCCAHVTTANPETGPQLV